MRRLSVPMAEIRGSQGRLGFDKMLTKTRLESTTATSPYLYSTVCAGWSQHTTTSESVLGEGS